MYAQAQREIRARQDLLAIVSHELRNPLAALSNAVYLLNLAPRDLRTSEQARATMTRQLAHMVRLVDDLLDVSRITGDRLALRPREDRALVGHLSCGRVEPRGDGEEGPALALVRHLVEMHEGHVVAHSKGVGHGSEFIVRIPIAQPPHPPVAQGTSVPNAATGRRILVVDDNVDAAASLARLLRIFGNETLLAHDGLRGVELALDFHPEVVLLDIGLPKLNGYDAARRIRAEPWGAGMFLVALTGWGQDEDRRRSREAGFDRHLLKPVALGALMQLLAELPRASR